MAGGAGEAVQVIILITDQQSTLTNQILTHAAVLQTYILVLHTEVFPIHTVEINSQTKEKKIFCYEKYLMMRVSRVLKAEKNVR